MPAWPWSPLANEQRYLTFVLQKTITANAPLHALCRAQPFMFSPPYLVSPAGGNWPCLTFPLAIACTTRNRTGRYCTAVLKWDTECETCKEKKKKKKIVTSNFIVYFLGTSRIYVPFFCSAEWMHFTISLAMLHTYETGNFMHLSKHRYH
ncbi:hypothetical protein CC78DRAFT_63982 [Lojkania enalia]|uniref:Uncharacterized protein n=1 Tax=Lojkania enalia TaxID=147567 RepID=A0A9P4KFB9_9PLEO|nr:hypothetical protein CC78DRAFT_63982 [Didymosphaeria enalia]